MVRCLSHRLLCEVSRRRRPPQHCTRRHILCRQDVTLNDCCAGWHHLVGDAVQREPGVRSCLLSRQPLLWVMLQCKQYVISA
jgi:hypothetical protein